MSRKVNYLIVGQGIAGCLLSYFLYKRNKSFIVIDQENPNASSRIAAGLFNPITGRRIVKTWKADVLFPFAESTYKELETSLGVSFYHQKNIFKLFTSVKEQNDWLSKSSGPEFEHYVLSEGAHRLKNPAVPEAFGGFEITRSGYVDIPVFLQNYRTLLIQNNSLREEAFDYTALNILPESVIWKDIEAEKIIFCEGHKAVENPFFGDLPFVLTKGELLTIKAPQLNLEKIISKGLFMLPLGNNNYKVGATYSWNELDELPTEKGKKELIEKLSSVIDCDFEILEHKAGIRPTVKDRRPFIGLHAKHNNVGVFNGMGTKGSFLAPYFAQHFVEHLLDGKSLDPEVDIERFR